MAVKTLCQHRKVFLRLTNTPKNHSSSSGNKCLRGSHQGQQHGGMFIRGWLDFHSLKNLTTKVALLGLLLLVVGASLPGVDAIRILIVHPLYAGSHALTLQVW